MVTVRIYERSYIWINCGERYKVMIDHRSYTYNLSNCEIKVGNKFRLERDSVMVTIWRQWLQTDVTALILPDSWGIYFDFYCVYIKIHLLITFVS